MKYYKPKGTLFCSLTPATGKADNRLHLQPQSFQKKDLCVSGFVFVLKLFNFQVPEIGPGSCLVWNVPGLLYLGNQREKNQRQ